MSNRRTDGETDYIHGVRGDIVREQQRLDAEQELALLRQGKGHSGELPLGTTPLVTFEPAERRAMEADVAKYVVAITFMSRHDNARPHIVTRHFDDSLTCTCQASAPCWGIKAFKAAVGIQ